MGWSEEQLAVIAHRGGNLLVSAAAGAGKTAVLIERIMGRILDKDLPINLDELLVVTFTRDAAREMKERIGRAISEKLEEEVKKDPNSKLSLRLMKQSYLISEMQMSTIDSFCKRVVMENFKEAEIDPGVRTMDETEGVIIRKKVLEDLLEAEYEKKDEEFINFVEYFVRGKSDKLLEDLILQLYRFSESLPDKEEWYNRELYKTSEVFKGSELEKLILAHCKKIISEFIKDVESFINISLSSDGPYLYESTGVADLTVFREFVEVESFESLAELMKNLSFTRLPTKKMENLDGAKKELAKAVRDRYKDGINKLKEDFFFENPNEIETSIETTGRVVKELIRLTREFGLAYMDEKKKRNVVDISDWAHFAIKVLLDGDSPSQAAKAYREQFAEIMIDEYQDSNLLQEKILTAIARNEEGRSNIFMVGDVKQSIYKFRQAKPELFIEKYNKYGDGENNKKIDLYRNYRSGPEVIETVNAVFKRTMKEELGGIGYDDKAKLIQGNEKKIINERNMSEVLIFDKDGEIPEKLSKLSDIELEAYMIADRIKRLVKEDGKLKYSDITILLRTNVEWAESFRRILLSENIPAVCESSVGYFSAWEVQVMISLLKILDNPRQDLPLATVLLSPIGGFVEKELAEFRINNKEEADLWTLLSLSENEKAVHFLNMINEKRAVMIFTPVHELIRQLFTETNFYSYVQAMPSGETRAANLDMLVSKAKSYEATSLHGVVHFVRYIDRLKKYEVDFGEAGTGGVEAVRIMSIHKSKGLQYRVVFVSGMAKSMNNRDSMASVVIHSDLGIGIDYFNIETREKKSTLLKKLISGRFRLENIAEEIRLLYVALTRAENKLILTACLDKVEERLENYANDEQGYASLLKINSLLDIAMPALISEKDEGRLRLTVKTAKDLVDSKMDDMAEKGLIKSDITKLISNLPETTEYKEISDMITKEKEYVYPFSEAVGLKSKMTVSELKRLHLDEEEAGEVPYKEAFREKAAFESYIPEFISEKPEEVRGAVRGTLYHLILSRMDFGKDYEEEEIREYLSKLVFDKKITNEELESIDISQFKNFFASSLYKRMKKAFMDGKLFRETPFVIGIDKEIDGDTEMVLVQGIIDAWFMEGDSVILMDYKTDRVFGKTGEDELIKRYRVQLDNYGEALKRITGQMPKEKLIYSFTLGREILLED